MKKDRDGVASWVLGRSIQLDKLLPLHPRMLPWIVGFAEDNNEVLPCTSIGIVTVQLESLQFKKLFESDGWNYLSICCLYCSIARTTRTDERKLRRRRRPDPSKPFWGLRGPKSGPGRQLQRPPPLPRRR